MTVLVMRANSPRYRAACATCRQRVRVGRRFVVDPVATDQIRHELCRKRLSR